MWIDILIKVNYFCFINLAVIQRIGTLHFYFCKYTFFITYICTAENQLNLFLLTAARRAQVRRLRQDRPRRV